MVFDFEKQNFSYNNSVWKLHFALILTYIHLATTLQLPQTASISSSWINLDDTATGFNGSTGRMRPILVSDNGLSTPTCACGFYRSFENYKFGVVIAYNVESSGLVDPHLVWHANGNKPVKNNATLQLTSEGDLILRDVDGTLAWSSNTTGKSVAGLNMTSSGNLVLFDGNNAVVWQSFDHPTDTLVQDQILVPGQELRGAVADSNWTNSLYSLPVTREGLLASVKTDPLQVFYEHQFSDKTGRYAQFRNGSLSNLQRILEGNSRQSSAQFLRLTSDGHLKVYEHTSRGWIVVDDLLTRNLTLRECNYPLVCGSYGLCTNDNQCICPPGSSSLIHPSNYFKPITPEQPNQGCSPVTPLTCEASKSQSFITLEEVTYFSLTPNFEHIDVDHCKEACLQNCSCKAAIFYGASYRKGSCYLATNDILSLVRNDRRMTNYITTAFIKVQNATNSIGIASTFKLPLKVGIGVGCSLFVFVIGVLSMVLWKKRQIHEEDCLDLIPGMPSRFSYEELKIATENFNKKLGQGGFGSVFEGVLIDGTKVAVKCLNGIGEVKCSFLAEVETIGRIHQVNLVQLVGFCAEKAHRLLIYEYMTNGSLDMWIYNITKRIVLNWECRRKIIHDIAKGLAYLHEECRQKIMHLDIKPQNILLDEDFSAKISDFGLAKLIDRKQSKVFTTMKGTPGYLAPEWLSGVVTEKVDVYSFGIVLLELLCGRRHFDESEPEECWHLLSLFKGKAEEGQLADLIDKHSEDMQLHIVEVEEMMRVAAWCLMSDSRKRPSMSMIVKVLEGVMEVDTDLNYNLLISTPERIYQTKLADSTKLSRS